MKAFLSRFGGDRDSGNRVVVLGEDGNPLPNQPPPVKSSSSYWGLTAAVGAIGFTVLIATRIKIADASQ